MSQYKVISISIDGVDYIRKDSMQPVLTPQAEVWLAAAQQRERAAYQLTLGKLIESLEGMPKGAEVANLCGLHSYRGFYDDLAFELHAEPPRRPASELLTECRAAMGKVFKGYKGGDFVMGALTPLWIAEYGGCGVALLAVQAGGTVQTEAPHAD